MYASPCRSSGSSCVHVKPAFTNEVAEVVAGEKAVACERVEAEEPVVRLMNRRPLSARLALDPSASEEGGDQALHRRPGEVGEKERAAGCESKGDSIDQKL